jgi:large subunit ribosomal protein L10e
MALRKASCYSKMKAVPYTRKSKKQKLSYIKATPYTKVTKFRMGDLAGYKIGKYKTILTIKTKGFVQMRDTALEAARQYLNRFLTQQMGKEFYFELKPYPHHVIRENKMLTGAGADRMSSGMARSFGKTTGRAALIKENSALFIIGLNGAKNEQATRKLLTSIKSRLPCRIMVETEYKK